MTRSTRIARESLVDVLFVAFMLVLIPFVGDEYLLTVIFACIIALAFIVRRARHDLAAFVAGLALMTAAEYLFVSTGVETFTHHTLFGLMPLWLPLLWAYGFVVIKRILHALDAHA
ncbi:MAG: DUF2878 family protein [Patescibacteria group bacterium]|nr:DUF2878 family protein [Patescibacteria group bacterium]MDE1965772.1 DUF2878 family protein [Patescibacteria group bacterium]